MKYHVVMRSRTSLTIFPDSRKRICNDKRNGTSTGNALGGIPPRVTVSSRLVIQRVGARTVINL